MADDGRDIYVTLGDGAVFGEVCISCCTWGIYSGSPTHLLLDDIQIHVSWGTRVRLLYLVLSFEGSVFGTVFGEVWIYGA